MKFSKHVCWNLGMVEAVMDVEATHPPEHLFLATHHPISMYREDLIEGKSKIEYTEEDFLKDFLAPTDFAFVPILGESGTGKSHLIRWLYNRIKNLKKDDRSCRVLLIPKVGTNLKSIIELILKDMEGQEFDEYRRRLQSSSNSLTEKEACVQLLDNLAYAVVRRPGQTHPISAKEGFEYITEDSGLYSLLKDVHFQKNYWLKDNGIISRLISHTLGKRDTVEDVEERREFKVQDLPTSVIEIQRAGEDAREFLIDLVDDDEMQNEVVKWLNLHLDEAIAKVLNLGREDLQSLMLDVRRSLAKQGIELILLIEDFAKLQGIDREVLESVLARPQQVTGEPLCAIRTALACTTGYFKGLEDTVKTRTSFRVNLDIEAVGNQSLITQEDIQALVAKYLNAVRLDNQRIKEWAESLNEESYQSSQSLISACSECPYITSCHEGFGQVDGMGIYPFTTKALERMQTRVNQSIKKDLFNPRLLIKQVLRHTIEYHYNEIKQGEFPSLKLHNHFGGSKLSAILDKDIQDRDPSNAERRKVLIDLWTDGTDLHDLHLSIHEAFDLPQVGILPAVAPVLPVKPDDDIEKATLIGKEAFPPLVLNEHYEAIDKWKNGERLSAEVGQSLRVLLYDSIVQRIDWDSEMLLKQKTGKLFSKAANISFENSTRPQVSGLELHLPLSLAEKVDTAIALQGLLLYNHYKHWKFPDGPRYFRIYAKKLEQWSDYVLDHIQKSVRKSGKIWDPVPATVEILAIGSRMVGRSSENEEALINGLFKDFTETELDVSNRSSDWARVFTSIKDKRSELLDILQSRIACTKGGSSKLQIIDASQLIKPLKVISTDWQPKCVIPDDLTSEYQVIAKIREKIDDLLKKAVIEERDRQLKTYTFMIQELGESFSQKDVVAILKNAIIDSQNAGIAVNAPNLEGLIQDFEKLKIKAYMDNMKKIQHEENIGLLLEKLSSTAYSQRTIDVIEAFLEQAKKFLDSSIVRVQKSIVDLPSGGDLELIFQSIESGLATLNSFAIEIKGEKTL